MDNMKRRWRENTSLRVVSIKGGATLCEMDNGREVKVDFQNIPFEVRIGDFMDATVYYKPGSRQIESIVVTQRNRC